MIIAAADIGGTHSRWNLIEPRPNGKYHLQQEFNFSNATFSNFYDLLAHVIELSPCLSIDRLSLALAGPTQGDRIKLTNIDWVVDRQHIARHFGITEVRLINDLQAAALGTFHIPEPDLIALNDNPIEIRQCRVVIGAGTGLGMAYLHWEGRSPVSFATEGGHLQFAPASDEQFRLEQFLHEKYGRVSYERIISGQGLVDLYAFAARPEHKPASAEWVSQQATTDNPAARKALRLWAEVYGSYVGNMATLFHPQGGIFLVGGLSHKLSYWLKSATFYNALIDQGRMQPRVKRIPVQLVTNDQVGLLGAIQFSLFDAKQHKEMDS